MSDEAITDGAPEGWVLVPVEPTEAMLDAFWHQTGESREMKARIFKRGERFYRAMISAALAKAHPQGGES